MSHHPNKLYDRKHGRVYPVEVRLSDADTYVGEIDLSNAPVDVIRLFERYAELVEDQVFGLLGEVEQQVDRLGVEVGFQDTDGTQPVRDLQVFGSRVAFRLSA
jgi:hypothetical protein